MNKNPESSNRVPVADLAVDACSARIEIPQSVKHIMREQALDRPYSDIAEEVARLKHELTESRNAERLVRMQLAEARETKNKKCN